MKPFKAQCNEVKRKGYITVTGRKCKPLLCEEQIWFEPSLKKGYFIGRCKNVSHNSVYRIVTV